MRHHEWQRMVNPVYSAAPSWCAELSPSGAQTLKRTVPKGMHEQIKRLFPAYSIPIEMRLQAMNRLIEYRKHRHIVGLSCGNASRGDADLLRGDHHGRIDAGQYLPCRADRRQPMLPVRGMKGNALENCMRRTG